MRSTYLAMFFMLTLMVFFGAGCSKPQATATQTNPVATKGSPAPQPKAIQTPTLSPADELSGVLDAFRNVKSFRVRYTFPSSQGSVSTTLSFARPDRFQGSMQVNGQAPVDVIIVQNSMYMKLPQIGWMDLTGTPSAAATSDALQKAINGNTSLGNLGIDKDSNVQKTTDAARGCDLFTATLHGQDGSSLPLKICVENSLPKFVEIQTKTGTINFEYFDYNSVFLIERPPVRK